MLADARLVAGKDLRIERRSKVGLGQMVPFAVLVLVLFAFALDPDRGILTRATAGLYWVAVLFSGLLAVQRAFAVESAPGVREALRLSGLDPAGYFLGKAAAIAVQLLVLEVVLGVGVVVLYGARSRRSAAARRDLRWPRPVAIAAAGTLYGVLAAGLRVRDTLVPLLLLPVARTGPPRRHPGVGSGARRRRSATVGRWCGLLATFGVLYIDLRHACSSARSWRRRDNDSPRPPRPIASVADAADLDRRRGPPGSSAC